METQIFLAEEKNKNFEEEILNLNKILDNKNSLIKEIENKSDNYFSQIQQANETIANLQGEFKTLSKELTDLHGKNKRYEEKVRSYEKNFNENKYVKEKLLDYEENLKVLKNEKVNLDKENKFIKSENIKLQ
jgi:chromosome segregation ATPase